MDLLIRLREWGRRRGRPISDPDPADRLAGCVRGRPDSTAGARAVSIKSRLNEKWDRRNLEVTGDPCRPLRSPAVAADGDLTANCLRGFPP